MDKRTCTALAATLAAALILGTVSCSGDQKSGGARGKNLATANNGKVIGGRRRRAEPSPSCPTRTSRTSTRPATGS